jgi:hypothetical protein
LSVSICDEATGDAIFPKFPLAIITSSFHMNIIRYGRTGISINGKPAFGQHRKAEICLERASLMRKQMPATILFAFCSSCNCGPQNRSFG